MYHVVDKSTGAIVDVGQEGASLDHFDRELYDVWTGRDPVERRAFYYAGALMVSKAVVLLSANKTGIAADGQDYATVSVDVEGDPASIELDVGGTATTVVLVDGAGSFEVASTTAVNITISPADDIYYQGESLVIVAE